MRVFFSTGEASGELAATLLAEAIADYAARDASAPAVRPSLSGIGSDRLRAAGARIIWDTKNWASLGPLEAARKIPKLFVIMWLTALVLRVAPPALIVLVDFGAFNLRLAKTLRLLGYPRPILYFFPPGAWLDNAEQARAVARWTRPLTAFGHQRDFYRSLGLEIDYFGHPLAPSLPARAPRLPPPADGGILALLPGSRRGEVMRHAVPLLAAARQLRGRRPRLEIVASAADDAMAGLIGEAMAVTDVGPVRIVRGARSALAAADAALIASGTAVLEAALLEVPCAALYIVSPAQERIGRRIQRRIYGGGRFITLPNLVLGRAVVEELLQEQATPQALAATASRLLDEPEAQRAAFAELRAALGPADALERCAAFALTLATGR